MTHRFVHYINSVQKVHQPILLGTSVVDSHSSSKTITGHSFNINNLSVADQESIRLGLTFLLLNPEDSEIVLGGIETRHAN